MKNHLQNFIVILLFLILDLSAFAKGPPCPGCPPTDDTGGGLEENDLPIDGQLIWLAICGIIFAFYIFSKNSKTNALE